MNPQIGLGIDVGGTYTDVILLDFAHGDVITSIKELTTRPDPSIGIHRALSKMDPAPLSHVRLVSLATTFATNAVVEGQGAQAGLILIGYDGIPADIPGATPIFEIAGGHTVSGEERVPLDTKMLGKRLPSFLKGLDAVSITGFFSVRNPDHECWVGQMVQQMCHIPVVLGHQLSMRLDAHRRAITAWWNARLIPLIRNLIQATSRVLSEKGLSAPLMVVRGDGTLMSEQVALQRPIDTLLSGPAASILGMKHLSGCDRALTVDIGGTTTDMALLADGRVTLNPDGATVGGWKTHVEAARVRTIGLGGDSLISIDENRQILIGPRRVLPLCVLAAENPAIFNLLKVIQYKISEFQNFQVNPCSFFVADDPSRQSPIDSSITSEFLLLEKGNNWSTFWELCRLENKGKVFRSSLTPTDIRVATGKFHFGNRDAAKLGLNLFARSLGMEDSAFAQAVEETIQKKLCLGAVAFLENSNGEVLSWLEDRWLGQKECSKDATLKFALSLNVPVVGAGAPAAAYLPAAFHLLHTECILPKNYPVAGAVGAIVGTVEITLSGRIGFTDSHEYSLHTPAGKELFPTREEAIQRGKIILEDMAWSQMLQNKVAEPILHFSAEDKVTSLRGEKVYLETALHVRANGRPNLGGGR